MKFLILIISILSVVSCTPKLDNEKNGQSYAVGYTLGQQLTRVKGDIDPKIAAMGLIDGIEGKAKLDANAISERMVGLNGKHREHEAQDAAEMAKKSVAYIESVAAKTGVKKLADGAFYEVVKPATSGSDDVKAIAPTDKVTISYVGKRIDGGTFDQISDPNGVTVQFKDLIIPGLKLAVEKMGIGSQWVLHLSPEMAFGSLTRPGVPPQSAVIYEIALLGVQKATQAPATKKK